MRIELIEGYVDIFHKLSDKEGNVYYSLWTYDINELEGIFEESDIKDEYKLMEVIEDNAKIKTDNIIMNKPKEVNMIVCDINDNDIDHNELDLKWESYEIANIEIDNIHME